MKLYYILYYILYFIKLMNRVGNYKLTHTLGEGAFAKVKCNVKNNNIKIYY